jgi:hypothetical protein
MIGTPEAKEASSYPSQFKQCCSLMVPGMMQNMFGTAAAQSYGGILAGIGHCCNIVVCPTEMYSNLDYRLYTMAHRKLGYKEYAGPFGLKSPDGVARDPGMQMDCPFTAPCMYCLIYSRLKTFTSSGENVPYAPGVSYEEPKFETTPTKMFANPCDDALSGEWLPTYKCWQNDLTGCFMYGCGPCTLGITSCLATCQIGELIGTEEAKAHTSLVGQLTGCATACFPCLLCEQFIPKYLANYNRTVLAMAKEKLGKTHYPMPAGLPLTMGVQMDSPCTAPCTYCLILAELKAQAANGGTGPSDTSKDGTADDEKKTLLNPAGEATGASETAPDETSKDEPTAPPGGGAA